CNNLSQETSRASSPGPLDIPHCKSPGLIPEGQRLPRSLASCLFIAPPQRWQAASPARKIPRNHGQRGTRMEQLKTCPKCGSGEYTFRGRKKIEAEAEKGEPEAWLTRYRCKSCGHEWKVKQPV